MKKCLTLKEIVFEELKDKEFKRNYEKEGRRLDIGHKIKVTKKLLKQLKPFWREFRKIQDRYDIKLRKLEEKMVRETGIKNIEFFFCDNEISGIGNVERTLPLIRDEECAKLETLAVRERGKEERVTKKFIDSFKK